MTDRHRSLGRVALGALAVFMLVLAVLAVQMRRGHDPGLGGKQTAAVTAAAPQRVLVRRIELRRVIVHIVPTPAEEGPSAAPITVPANVTVVQSAPAAATVAPTPAVAPAPVVTRTS
jgi:hypothetical protein